jgi:hypothetical protein
LGYKSVAHYLIQTRRANTDDVEKNDDASNPVSAKRSLPFSDDGNENKLGSMQSLAEAETDGGEVATKRSLIFPDEQDQLAKLEKVEGLDTVKALASSTKPSPSDEQDQLVTLEKVEGLDTVKALSSSTKPSPGEQDKLVMLEKVEGLDTVKQLASSNKSSPDEQDQLVTLEKVKGSDTVKPLASSTKPCPDSIAGRLRSRTSRLQKP